MGREMMIAVGSPRKRGNSSTLSAQVAAGAQAAGAQVETFYLHGMNIKPCTACGGCRKKIHVDCVIKDDMQLLYRSSGVRCHRHCHPIYWFTFRPRQSFSWTVVWAGRDKVCTGWEKIRRPPELCGCRSLSVGRRQCSPHSPGCTAVYRSRAGGMVYGSASEAGEIKKNKVLMKEAYELGRKLAGNEEIPLEEITESRKPVSTGALLAFIISIGTGFGKGQPVPMIPVM